MVGTEKTMVSGAGVGLVLGLWNVLGEDLSFLGNGSLLTHEINGKGKRSFPIKFRSSLFKGLWGAGVKPRRQKGSGQGPEVFKWSQRP